MIKKKTSNSSKILAQNRKASFNYFFKEEYEAGIVLQGSEIKSLKNTKANIQEAFVEFDKDGELYLANSHIQSYKGIQLFNHKPTRKRKLLLHKTEIKKMIGKVKEKGLTIVPIAIYLNSRNIAKVKIAVAQGKKLYDKRASVKEREWKRDKQRMEKIDY